MSTRTTGNAEGSFLIAGPEWKGRDADGGLTLLIQYDSPGKERESNWLPAPNGPFQVQLRLYLPEPEVLEHKWKQPPLERVK